MENKKVKNGKIIYFCFGILMFVLLLASLVFMTQYQYIHLFLSDGKITSSATMGEQSQTYLWEVFANTNMTDKPAVINGNFDDYAQAVFNYRLSLDAFNDLILTTSVVGLCMFALLLIFSNHSRRVYYITNLIVGVAAPLVVVVMLIILIVQDINLMSFFEANYDLFNVVSVAQNGKNILAFRADSFNEIRSLYDCNSLTFILYMVIFALLIGYSLFIVGYSVKRYKASAEDRKNILTKAGILND